MPEDEDKLWPVCRAIPSSKVKHLSCYFRANLDGHRDSASGEWLFDLLWPDTSPGAPGDQPLSPQALRRWMDECMVKQAQEIDGQAQEIDGCHGHQPLAGTVWRMAIGKS